MQIKALEAHVGTKLIHFKNRKAYLTDSGKVLLGCAEGVYKSAVEVEQLFSQVHGAGSFGIGMAASFALHFFPVVEKFKEKHPLVRVIVRDGPSLRIIDELLDYKLDICIVARLDEARKDLLVHRVVNQERMVLVVSKKSVFSGRSDVSWIDLDGYPFIVHCDGSIVRKNVLSEFSKRGIAPNIVAEIDNIEYMKQLIQQGVGAAFMFFQNVRQEVAQDLLEVIPFTFGELCLGVDVVMRREHGIDPLCEDFLALVTDLLDQEVI
jgi:DNA-binding transcriptional LysR family regulator